MPDKKFDKPLNPDNFPDLPILTAAVPAVQPKKGEQDHDTLDGVVRDERVI